MVQASEIPQAQEIQTLTNSARSSAKLDPLSYSDALQNAASAKCTDMMNNKYYSHTSPSGVTPQQNIQKYISVPINSIWSGENIADGVYTSQSVFTAWMNSAGHKANILDTHYTSEGIAVCKSYDYTGGSLVVVDFAGTPSAPTNTEKQTTSTSDVLPVVDCTSLENQATQTSLAQSQTLEAQHQANLNQINSEWYGDPSELQYFTDQENTTYNQLNQNIWNAGAIYLESKGCQA